MKLILHLARTDLRRLLPWVMFITGVVVVMNAIGFWIVTFLPLNSEKYVAAVLLRVRASLDYLRLAGGIAGYVFVILLVQGDRTIGTTRFWLTRPISGMRLFTAKLLTTSLVLAVVPTILSLPWWWWCGFGWREMATASSEFCLAAVVLACPALFIGALTDSIARAVIWGSLIVPITIALVIAAAMNGQLSGLTGVPDVTVGWGARMPNTIVSMGVLLLTLATVAAAQYFWRRPPVSIAILLVGVGLVLGANVPTVSLGQRFAAAEYRAATADAIQLKFVQGTTSIGGQRGQQLGKSAVALNTSECPPGRLLAGGLTTQTWTWPGKLSVSRLSNAEVTPDLVTQSLRVAGYHFPPVDAETVAWRKMRSEAMFEKFIQTSRTEEQANGWRRRREEERRFILKLESLETVQPMGPEDAQLVVRANLPPSVAVRLRTDAAKYSARVTLSLLRPEFVDMMPAQSPTWHAERGRGLKAVHVASKETPIEFALIYTDPDNWAQFLLGLESTERQRRTVVMLNSSTREAFSSGWASGPKVTVNSVSITYSKMEIGTYVVRNGKYQPQPLPEGAVLARITYTEEARFTRSVDVDKFVAQGETP